MKMIDVKSSNIKSVGYDHDRSQLRVKFKNSGVYLYDDVPVEKFNELLAADSVGGYFHQNIKGAYEYERCDSD